MSLNKYFVIAIDGPAGAGKSTIALLVAKKLGFLYVDTGAMYRALTLKALRKKIPLDDKNLLIKMARKTSIELVMNDKGYKVFLDDVDVSKEIRQEEVSRSSHFIASIPEIREILWQIQRSYRNSHDIVMEGRDIGSIVFPDAQMKIYLDATVEARAIRRYKQLREEGIECDIEEVKKDIILRDKKDRYRKIAPLVKSENAIVIDSTSMTIDEEVNLIVDLYKKKCSEVKKI